jgi:histidinol-phosphate/aromatic aminotransferase/cobyric acid decarboxylase-like protein
MNYEDYKAFCRERLAREDAARLVRLDCMNPVKALAPLRREPPTTPPGRTAAEVARAWRRGFGLPQDDGLAVLVGRGVRDLLGAVYRQLAAEGYRLHVPEDVYPVYVRMAEQAGVTHRPFATVPRPQLPAEPPTDAPEALLLPNPLVPLGRPLEAHEVAHLRGWLGADPRRRLLVDAVYTFATSFEPSTRALLETGQVLLLHSLAKGHLAPDVAGFALGAPARVDALRPHVAEPLPELLSRAAWLLEEAPELPDRVEAAFRERWERLRTTLAPAGAPPFALPPSGYFTTCPEPFDALLRKGWLTVPATVFGSPSKDWSIVTCLLA